MNITLATRHANAKFSPLALLYLKAALLRDCTETAPNVTLTEFPPAAEAPVIAEGLLASHPDVIGLSCYVWNVEALVEAARLVKTRIPGTRIVLGGPEVGPLAERVLARYPWIDVIVRGEGEGPFAGVVAATGAGRDLAAVEGITYRSVSRNTATPDAPILKDLSRLASPHTLRDIDPRGRIICLETQRGCVFACGFCFYNKDYSIRNRRFDLDRVKEEIGFWLEQDAGEIYLMDPVFNLNAARAKDLCRFVAERNHRRIPFHTEVWAEFVDDEMAGLFADASFTFIEVGLQTTNDSALELSQRRLRREPFLNGIRALKAHRLAFELQLIAGLPGETLSSFRESLDFCAALDPPAMAVFPLLVLPGTALWKQAEALALAYDSKPPYRAQSHATMDAGDMTHAFTMAAAAQRLWEFRAIRALSRAPSLTYSAVVDGWIAFNGGRPAGADLSDALPSFIRDCCTRHGIADEIYVAGARLDLAASADQRYSA